MKDKILITGSDGLLGGAFMSHQSPYDLVGLSKFKIDITNEEETKEFINKIKPKFIIHTAAKTDLEWCETNKDEAFEVNVIGTKNILNAAIINYAHLIFVSSTGVYGNIKNSNYSELDKIDPRTWHHKTKIEAENLIRSSSISKYLILRTGWLFGSFNNRKDYVQHRIEESLQSKFIHSNKDQIGNPTYTLDFVKQTFLLIKKNVCGLYNCVNKAENVSRYDYTKMIVDILDLKTKILPTDSSHFKRLAPVSLNESAINEKLANLELDIMPEWGESLNNYLNNKLLSK